MTRLIESLAERYDHIVIDAPPVSGFADSLLLSRIVDGVLLVTSVGVTQRNLLQHTIGQILKVRGKIVGTVLNRLNPRKSKYGYGYYSYYGDREKDEEKHSISSPTA